MDETLYRLIALRRKVGGGGQDLLGLLVSTPGMEDGLIRDQLLTMLIAGHDTSTALLGWALYLLGKHPEAMEKATAEADAVLGTDPPTIESVACLDYLEKVMLEALRLYPPIHLGQRRAAQDLEFQGYRIPAGQRVVYSIYLTHRMPLYWPEPARFDPERFSPENARQRPHYTYLPFGGGPRNCIGLAFAQVEVKVVLARLLQRFELRLEPRKIHPHMGATLEPRPGVWMTVRERGL
jgi:cytochrome P450